MELAGILSHPSRVSNGLTKDQIENELVSSSNGNGSSLDHKEVVLEDQYGNTSVHSHLSASERAVYQDALSLTRLSPQMKAMRNRTENLLLGYYL